MEILYKNIQGMEGILPYLDISIHRASDGSLSTTWYTKSCASNRLLNFKSGHPVNTVINVGKNLVRRARALTTKDDDRLDAKLRSILKLNDFPDKIIRRIMRPNERIPARDAAAGSANEPRTYKSMSYIRGVSERMRKLIARDTNVSPAFSTREKVGNYFSRLKDPVPLGQRRHVVYEIPCGDCHKTYIGTTSQMLSKRVSQHEGDCRPPVRNKEVSALCAHSVGSGHSFKFGETKIIDTHQTYEKRLLLEALHIKRNQHKTVNKRSDYAGLSVMTSLWNDLDNADAPPTADE